MCVFTGTFLAYVVFTFLNAKGLTTLGGFMRWWGFGFLASIAAVLVMARNDEHSRRGGTGFGATAKRVLYTYGEMGKVLVLPTVRQLALVLLVNRLPFVASDVLLPLELLKNGFKKEHIVSLSLPHTTEIPPRALAAACGHRDSASSSLAHARRAPTC